MSNVPAYAPSSVCPQQQVGCHGEHCFFQPGITIKFNNVVRSKYPEYKVYGELLCSACPY